ncbi:hypothetical protein EV645_3978 [Kribbella rubisoli]|uniref:Uncharacterized protein n=1 Tax=Kribbella rubisoli TaxID=3075929 RepID=A0A4Q7X1V5_9ACTN|nr:hypothetical protein EV645_3978 [Kribbella rubisoli]
MSNTLTVSDHRSLTLLQSLHEVELRHRIQVGIEAADELKRRLAQLERDRPEDRPARRPVLEVVR